MKITIIDYGLGNLASVSNALGKLNISYVITSDLTAIKESSAIILPGVGSAEAGMRNLRAAGLDSVIIEKAMKGTPILGICLGMQLMMSFSEEGDTMCLDLIKGKVKKFRTRFKIPQIGWNNVRIQNSELRIHNLFKNIKDNSYFYFVNSYYCAPADETVIAGVTNYGKNFCSAFSYENIYGVQFHPEKSGETGLKLLKNFYEIAKLK